MDKGTRILDAAEDLLLRVGYRKVAIAEVAERAGVGKGTVYLYWPSKAELFGAVLTRDSVRRLDTQLAALRADPAECRVHRTQRTLFCEVLAAPLARALYTRDVTMLGELLNAAGRFTAGKAETTRRYLEVMYRHGLLADDPAADETLVYRLSATVGGTFLLEGLTGDAGPGIDAKADALATTLRRAFEPAREPSAAALRRAATEVTDLYRHWRDELAGTLPEGACPDLTEVAHARD